MTGNGWLSDVVVLNESSDMRVAGDVTLFRSAGEACTWIEPWWVANQEGFAFTAAGERLVLEVTPEQNVRVERREPHPDGEAIVLDWLRSNALHLLETRKARAEKGHLGPGGFEERGELPDTIEGLIAYIGFQWAPPPIPVWLVIALFLLVVMIVFFVGIWSVRLIGWLL